MRTIYCLLLILWVSYCLAAPTSERDDAIKRIVAEMQDIYKTYVDSKIESYNNRKFELALAEFYQWADEVDAFFNNYQYSDSEGPTLFTMEGFILQCMAKLSGIASGSERLAEKIQCLQSRSQQLLGHVKERIENAYLPQAYQSMDTEEHPTFIPSHLSNPHDYSPYDSTHTGSGSTSGRSRLRDHSSHGAGPSDGGNPRSKIQRTEFRGRGRD
ncbi:hypothetical protein SeMB42_g01102 [Synchytrium endobioticum]|uniref:Uncharacterized protein n=1 Tax=Synchytrium endobioticum TaxID=286115 RepID=A0A507DPY9_9FUNG|nr:hypothetical protein SeMB42_g01102 [Synchytrium endobioticum]